MQSSTLGAGCAEVVGQLLAEIGGVIGPGRRGLQQAGVGLRARGLLVAVVDEEVRRDAEVLERGQHHRRPAVVRRRCADW